MVLRLFLFGVSAKTAYSGVVVFAKLHHLRLLTITKKAFTKMDKKAKKRLEVLRKRQEKLRQQLAGAKSQMDDPSEVESLEQEIEKVKAEVEKLKNS